MLSFSQPSNLIAVTKVIASKNLDTDFDTILDFIILHSKIASLIFHRKRRSPLYKCYEEYFAYDVQLMRTLKDFLEGTLARAESMWRRDNENLNYLTVRLEFWLFTIVDGRQTELTGFSSSSFFQMIEYLQIDISEFDTLIKDLEK